MSSNRFGRLLLKVRPKGEVEAAFKISGRGIKGRFHRLSQHWNGHLQHCLDSQTGWCNTWQSKHSLAVLGAGRLNDLALGDLQYRTENITLFDADASCRSTWKKLAKHYPLNSFEFRNEDFTNSLEQHRQELKSKVRECTWDDALKCLRQLGKNPLPPSSFLKDSSEALLSLNTLSQIPIYWRYLAEKIFLKRFGAKQLSKNESEWLEAFEPSARSLIKQHIKDFAKHPAKEKLLITDTTYLHYYGTINYDIASTTPLPFIMDNAAWEINQEVEEGISKVECIDALHDISLVEQINQTNSKSFSVVDKWFWHIAPKGCAQKTHGELHIVEALSL